MELSVLGCRLPRISRRPSSAWRSSGSAAPRACSDADRRASRATSPAPRGIVALSGRIGSNWGELGEFGKTVRTQAHRQYVFRACEHGSTPGRAPTLP
eukprot:scaffold23178_cov54-Phaeocystis_antarctica.AAC.2